MEKKTDNRRTEWMERKVEDILSEKLPNLAAA